MDDEKVGSGSAVIPAARIRMVDDAVLVGAPCDYKGMGEPKVHLVREDGVIKAIDVTCTCGASVRIKCEYN